MKFLSRLFGTWLVLGCAAAVWAQPLGPKVDRVDVKFVGPATVSEQFVRANLRLKAGDTYFPNATVDDTHSLYATKQFYNIRVTVEPVADGGVIVTYLVQARLRLTDIKIEGNKKVKDSKIRKKITVKVGQPIDEQKLFTDCQEIRKLYEKYGYAGSEVKYVLNMDESAGKGSVTFVITEAPKIKIQAIEFVGAAAFTQRQLRGELKTKRHWMWSWLTGNGMFKEDEFEDDREQLATFYHNHGYLDFEIKDVRFRHPTTNSLVIVFYLYEGRQYRVGTVTFTGNKLFTLDEIRRGLKIVHDFQHSKAKLGSHGLSMDTGDIFTPDGLSKDTQAVEDFYGSKGYIDVQSGPTLRAIYVPNVETGTMDLEFQVKEGQKSYVELINIRGNEKTKDKVIRRELAISPGEVFDMVRVKISKQRLEGLQYFEKVDMRPEATDPPMAGRKNLIVNVAEQNTGNFMLGAGFSSVDQLVGYVEVTQGNADLFHPPTFTGAGQKLRLFVQLGTQRQDYELSFIEPWFLNRKLALGVSFYRHQLNFESPNDIYDETRTGMTLSLRRALWSDFLEGSINYTLEDVGIDLNSGYHGYKYTVAGNPPTPTILQPNVPDAILEQTGNHVYSRFGASLAYDTRNSTRLPNHGQRTEFNPEFSIGDSTYYKLNLKTSWYFPGLFTGHVLEVVGRGGVADSVSGGDVPFYDRYYLGGLYSLRGFKFRNISPRQPFNPMNPGVKEEPIGGDTYWFASAEYSLPIFETDNGPGVRFAVFYDVGSVYDNAYSFTGSNFDDDWGLGLHINIPKLGPIRLEYGIPIHHDNYNGDSGRFQFGVGWNRPF
ncbi:MAG TPA: outer membrane protein assembly factor BamA [Candidatus Acidoferrum sp.]|nr:outer membrane protein assembly factor BamA [Candidatus Acidoferrum sp.]